jgi:hypothetical protein
VLGAAATTDDPAEAVRQDAAAKESIQLLVDVLGKTSAVRAGRGERIAEAVHLGGDEPIEQ